MNIQEIFAQPFLQAIKDFFIELRVPVNYVTDEPASAKEILKEHYRETPTFQMVDEVYFAGMIDDAAFAGKKSLSADQINPDYEGILIFGITLHPRNNNLLPTRSQLAEISRAFNRCYSYTPVVLLFKYTSDQNEFIAFTNTERTRYKQERLEGERAGKVTMLKDISLRNTHAAHVGILSGLPIDTNKIDTFRKLNDYWQTVFSLQALNDRFYSDLQDWFYFAIQKIKLPYRPEYLNEKENIKNFLVRLLARTMFCWFVKEKKLIRPELLELTDWNGAKFNLTKDIDDKEFPNSNSYYRGILQNVFFNALNQKEKKTLKDFRWTQYLHQDMPIEWLSQIPYLNGGLFDKLEEDNARESIEDSVIAIPNFLFYGTCISSQPDVEKGKKAKIPESTEHKGLNGILKSYKFTLDENTPFEEEIALDPEMLGLVFENLLAELDPNLEESTLKSIRKLTGSYYTPRKVIYEMVNDSLYLYLFGFLQRNFAYLGEIQKSVRELVYLNNNTDNREPFNKAVVHALDKFKTLDPACGSGAFPMGMLHRMVDILKLVDEKNQLWIELKLKNVDPAQRTDFKKILTSHLDNYSRKLGIIRDCIYGIDIQPMAVQITKLRFFISLLIDQKTETGIAPMPNIETKIICADSLKNIQADLFSSDAIGLLTEARTRYYQPDITLTEREEIADDIVEILDKAFPEFAFKITGKRIKTQNKVLLKEWFKHSSIAAPFFNIDFFFPELRTCDGFDCVLGNPPYGGAKISDEVRNALGIESKDPYGAFIARFINDAAKPTPLKHGGILAFIVSDTFMTIKSHLPLRRLMMQNYIHKIMRMHPDTFRATVNASILVCERNMHTKTVTGIQSISFNDNHTCLMADMTNISIHENYERFTEILNQTRIPESNPDGTVPVFSISSDEFALFRYNQSLIRNNNNLPFFVASPRLFKFQYNISPVQNNSVFEPNICFIVKESKFFKIGESYYGLGKSKKWNSDGLFKVISGIKTGNNAKYLKDNVPTHLILSEENAICLLDSEKENGIKGNKYYISFEIGKSSDSETGMLPCYYQATDDIFINWSESSVLNMKKEAHSDLANKEFRFVPLEKQISFSTTGQYAPTFRNSTGLIFLNKASRLFINYKGSQYTWLGVLNSKLFKYFSINFSNHSVEFGIEDLKGIIINIQYHDIDTLVKDIMNKQQINPYFDYASHEQIEIDKLVYEAYELSGEDVLEVENWYARRYPKLSAAQKQNLRNLGKSDDYLELYGMKNV